ncbi:MAG: serine/threonine-protein phosphatase, partial [Chlamydiia bacterium]|nr:serine/threonine-protein phosphatase [Chlamydiia bacterium]
QTRRLCYSTGGHPPLLLYPSADAKAPIALRTPGLVVGGMPDMDYQNGECTVDSGAKLYVFSDGVFELTNRDGSIANFNDFVRELSVIVSSGGTVEAVIGRARDLQGRPDFDDDYSMLEFRF